MRPRTTLASVFCVLSSYSSLITTYEEFFEWIAGALHGDEARAARACRLKRGINMLFGWNLNARAAGRDSYARFLKSGERTL